MSAPPKRMSKFAQAPHRTSRPAHITNSPASRTNQTGSTSTNAPAQGPIHLMQQALVGLSHLVQQSGVSDQLGNEGSQIIADGKITPDNVWGEKTHNALIAARNLARRLLQIAKDLNYSPQSYTANDFPGFYLYEKNTDYQANEKLRYAVPLTKQIVGVANLFREIKDKILVHEKNRPLVSGTQVLTSYKPTSTWSKEDLKLKEAVENGEHTNPISFTINYGGAEPLQASITPYDLVSDTNFNTWLNSEQAEELRQHQITKPMILQAIRNALPKQTTTPTG